MFSAPMVRALLAGTKTQTRRTVKGAPAFVMSFIGRDNLPTGEFGMQWTHERVINAHARCPYGVVGDRLWVKEAHRFEEWNEHGRAQVTYVADGALRRDVFVDVRDYDQWSDQRASQWTRAGAERLKYDEEVGDNVDATDDDDGEDCWLQMPAGKKPPVSVSIHMPRWASRITLEVIGVRVERLQSITEADAVAEGLDALSKDGGQTIKYGIADLDGLPGNDDVGWHWRDWHGDPRVAYRKLWERINGTGSWALKSWAANPWVFVVDFAVAEVRR